MSLRLVNLILFCAPFPILPGTETSESSPKDGGVPKIKEALAKHTVEVYEMLGNSWITFFQFVHISN